MVFLHVNWWNDKGSLLIYSSTRSLFPLRVWFTRIGYASMAVVRLGWHTWTPDRKRKDELYSSLNSYLIWKKLPSIWATVSCQLQRIFFKLVCYSKSFVCNLLVISSVVNCYIHERYISVNSNELLPHSQKTKIFSLEYTSTLKFYWSFLTTMILYSIKNLSCASMWLFMMKMPLAV